MQAIKALVVPQTELCIGCTPLSLPTSKLLYSRESQLFVGADPTDEPRPRAAL